MRYQIFETDDEDAFRIILWTSRGEFILEDDPDGNIKIICNALNGCSIVRLPPQNAQAINPVAVNFMFRLDAVLADAPRVVADWLDDELAREIIELRNAVLEEA